MESVTILQSDANYRSSTGSKELINKKILICAKRGSSKSWLIRSLYQNICEFKKFDRMYIVSCTEQDNPFFKDAIPRAIIRYKLTDEVLYELTNLGPNSLVILDDCIAYKHSGIKDRFEQILSKPGTTTFVT